MSDDCSSCCGPTAEQSTERPAASGRWLDERPVVAAPLPPEMEETMSRFYGESVETLGDFVSATRAETGGGPITVDNLCYVAEETPHVATTADETYHFQCFYDGVALASLAGEPVDIRTESPAGAPIEARVSPAGGIDATPSEAVMSFGIADDAATLVDDGPTVADVYGAICPYVKAFPDREGYERWATDVDAATVGLPLEAGLPIADALTDDV